MDDADLEHLAAEASALGLERLGAVALDHPGFALAHAALERYLDKGAEGEMGFMTRTRQQRMDPGQMLPGAQSALVAVVPYTGESGPIARYAQWIDYHMALTRRMISLSGALERRLPGVGHLVCVDTKPVLERSVAVLGGVGFLGKNGCLIVPGLGSYLLIAVLLTTAKWEGSDRAPADLAHGEASPWASCGSCRACLDGCPTAAFEAPGVLDPRRCIAYLTIEHRGEIAEPLRGQIGERLAGCDLCQEVCPYNHSESRVSRISAVARLPSAPGRARVADLPRLANIGSNQHRQFVKHTPLNRIPRPALRRNALIALGNAEGPVDEATREALIQASSDPSPLLSSLARWAAARRGMRLDV